MHPTPSARNLGYSFKEKSSTQWLEAGCQHELGRFGFEVLPPYVMQAGSYLAIDLKDSHKSRLEMATLYSGDKVIGSWDLKATNEEGQLLYFWRNWKEYRIFSMSQLGEPLNDFIISLPELPLRLIIDYEIKEKPSQGPKGVDKDLNDYEEHPHVSWCCPLESNVEVTRELLECFHQRENS